MASPTATAGFPSAATATPTPTLAPTSATSVLPPSTRATTPPPSTPPVPRDITHVKYTVPAGFARNDGFHEAIPLEDKYQATFLTPSAGASGLDVLTVLLYTLPGPHLVDTPAQQSARINEYNRKLAVSVLRPLQSTTVGGRPAFDETVVQPGGFRYGTWFVFGGQHLVQIGCQVDKQVNAVIAGCRTLLDSIALG